MLVQERISYPRQPEREDGGFTLVELLISIAVITMLAGMAAQTFRAVMTAREIAMRRLEINETARAALDFMSSELRSAYLTPDSVKPVVVSRLAQQDTGPRFRFAGISRDIVVDSKSKVPGAGKDDDGDGLIDEEVLDGLDGDYRSGASRALSGASPDPDPLGCDRATKCVSTKI
jgi:prepilin-type N-terminal cleavage/methylation domain-containing protein